MNLEGKKVIVTGGANGIGRATVERLLQEKASVAVMDIDVKGLSALEAISSNVHGFICDLTDHEAVEQCIENVWKKLETIHVLINNAGIVEDMPIFALKKHDVDAWHRVINLNLHAVFYVTRCVIEKMFNGRSGGIIINVSSVSSHGNEGQSSYAAAKAGVEALTKTWAKELAPLGIRVAGVSPGFTKTNMTATSMSEQKIETWKKRIPLRRMAEPEEIADAILFILKNDYVHGKILPIDGGLVL